MPRPHRRFRAEITIEADNIDEFELAIDAIAFAIISEGSRKCLSGGCGSGWHYEVTESEQTPEGYQSDLKEYLAATR